MEALKMSELKADDFDKISLVIRLKIYAHTQ